MTEAIPYESVVSHHLAASTQGGPICPPGGNILCFPPSVAIHTTPVSEKMDSFVHVFRYYLTWSKFILRTIGRPNTNRLRGEQPESEGKENGFLCKLNFIEDFWALLLLRKAGRTRKRLGLLWEAEAFLRNGENGDFFTAPPTSVRPR